MGLIQEQASSNTGREVVAVVPTKLTSVRLPRKNVADLGGRPLFYYSVRAAQLCPEIDSVYVSSEAPEILETAAGFGAEVIERPVELSDPKVTNLGVLEHALAEISHRRGGVPELLVLLQPTHPLRQPSAISRGVEQMRRDPQADTLLSVLKTDELRGEIRDGRYIPEFSLPRNKATEPNLYRNTGSFYIFRVANTVARGRMFTDSFLPLVLDRPEFEVDIDETSDLELARCVLAANREAFADFFEDGAGQ